MTLHRTAPAAVAAAIARAGAGNPLLSLGTGDGLPAARLCRPASGGPHAARDLIDAVARRIDALARRPDPPERRVAASLVMLGYAARLVGPTLAVLLGEDVLLDARPERVRYRYRPDTGFALCLPEPAGWHGPPEALCRAWCATVLDEHLGPVIDSVRAVVPVAAGLLWGNVASGVTGALRTLAEQGRVPAARCHATGLALLDHRGLNGTGELRIRAGRPEFRRRACCLYYRIAGGTCGDCPFDRAPAGRS